MSELCACPVRIDISENQMGFSVSPGTPSVREGGGMIHRTLKWKRTLEFSGLVSFCN
jgi:hypothetical protein